MGKWDPYSRRELRRLRRDYLRRNAPLVVIAIAVMVGIATGTVLLALSGPARWYVLGASHAALIAAGLHLLHTAHLAMDRDAIHHVRGAWGEDNTRSELRRARRKRIIWGWVDSINLQEGDLDHVVVLRRGGLLAIDTKWRNQVTKQDNINMARAADKARRRAEGLARSLLTREPGARHRARVQPFTVTPVVVVWGAAQKTVPDDAVIDGVPFVRGRDLLRWLDTLEGPAVPQEAATDALRRLRNYRNSVPAT